MHLDIFTPGTYLLIFLLCFTTDAPLTVKHIFEDNLNWAAFHLAEKDNLRDVEINEVNKMLSCKDESRGFFTYECEHCGITKTVYFGCNSRICTNCGKNHTDKWAPKCPNCGRKMTFLCYEKGPPSENGVFGCKLSDWNHPCLSHS